MTGAVYGRTPNLGLGLLEFSFPNWGDDANENTKIIDAGFSVVGIAIKGAWENNTPYVRGDLVIDVILNSIWRCNINHTSAATGTFEADRTANPTYWTDASTALHARGLYTTATTYYPNDVTYDTASKYAWALVSRQFLSTTWAADVASGALVIITDTTQTVTDANAAKTAAQASAAAADASKTAAATSATNAANSATASQTSATNSANSATAAQGYATDALTYSNNASTFATNASNSAATATTQANRAQSEADRAQSIANSMTPDAPSNGTSYGRLNGAWAAVAPLNSPILTGDPQAPTPTLGDFDNSIATTAFVANAIAQKANLASPTFTGDPKAPTPATSDNDTSLATTAYVKANMALVPGGTAQTRNRIVNPAMQVSQENGNTAGTTNIYYAADQWASSFVTTGTMAFVRDQAGGPTPNGSQDRLRFNVNAADTSIAATEYAMIQQPIEGLQIADFGWGAAGAKQVILRFGFRGPAGTYSVTIRNSALNRSYLANFTITAGQANTDTEQVLVIPGDTTGTWPKDETRGLYISIAFAAGSNFLGAAGWQAGNFLGAAGISNGLGAIGSFHIFDVGLYLDPNNTGLAPAWQLPEYADELARCQRYWQQVDSAFVTQGGTNAASYHVRGPLPVTPRLGSTISGVDAGAAINFPSTAGSLSIMASNRGFSESRISNLTNTGLSRYFTLMTINGRM